MSLILIAIGLFLLLKCRGNSKGISIIFAELVSHFPFLGEPCRSKSQLQHLYMCKNLEVCKLAPDNQVEFQVASRCMMLDSEYKLLSLIDEGVEKSHKSVQRSLYDRYVPSFIYSSAPAVTSIMLVSNLASLLLCLYLLFFSGSVSKPGGFEKGFQTDLGDYQPPITLTRIIEGT